MIGWLLGYAAVAAALAALGPPRGRGEAPVTAAEARLVGEVPCGFRPAPTQNVLVLAAHGPACEALAHHVSAFGLASTYTVAPEGQLAVAAAIATAGVPVWLGERGAAGAVVRPFASAKPAPWVGEGAGLPVRWYGGSGSVLVFLHGASSHGEAYASLAEALDAEVVLPTLRGHWGAPGAAGDVDGPHQLLDDVAALLRWVRERRPGARVVLGGHSTGAALALRFAAGPDAALADATLLLAPYLGPWSPATRWRTRGTWARPAPWRVLGLRLLGPLGYLLGGLPVLAFDPPAAVRDGRETLAYSHRLLDALTPRRREWAALGPRDLLLVGSGDEVFDPEGYAGAEIIEGATHLGVVFHPATCARLNQWLSC